MCEWDSEASHWHLAAGAHTLAAAVPGGTHNLVAAFLRGQQAPARCCFCPWGSHHLVAADAYGTRKLAVAPCWWQSQARGARVQQKPCPHRGSGWPNSSAYCSSFLADCRQRDSGACTHGHRSWALCCIHDHAVQRLPRTLVALSCACATCGPYMQ